jgi:hypothetical protein
MNVERVTRVALLLKRCPNVEEVFAWFGLEVDDEDLTLTVEDLARLNRLDVDELVDDLQATVDESDTPEDGDDEDDDFGEDREDAEDVTDLDEDVDIDDDEDEDVDLADEDDDVDWSDE